VEGQAGENRVRLPRRAARAVRKGRYRVSAVLA
jgi:hypothetical protein